MFIYVWGGGGTKAAVQNGACCVEPVAKIVKLGFRSFRSIVDQNTVFSQEGTGNLLKNAQVERNEF